MTRTVYAEVPPRVVYALTESGQGLRKVLDAMNEWALSIPRPDGLEELRTPAEACQSTAPMSRERDLALPLVDEVILSIAP